MIEPGLYRVLLDERWALEDLYEFPHAYSQTYSFAYCFDSELEPRNAARIDDALVNYPWRGGFSYVNIYFVLRNQIPIQHRPQIASIKYASPGWLDLLLNPDVAVQVAKSVGIYLGTLGSAAFTYKQIQKHLMEVSRKRAENRAAIVEIERREQRTYLAMCDDIAKHLGFSNTADLHRRTNNPEVSLKLLLAHYRRIEILSEFVQSGKAQLPLPPAERNDG